jgi:hypothetical protein
MLGKDIFYIFYFIFLCRGLFSVWCAASRPPPHATRAAPPRSTLHAPRSTLHACARLSVSSVSSVCLSVSSVCLVCLSRLSRLSRLSVALAPCHPVITLYVYTTHCLWLLIAKRIIMRHTYCKSLTINITSDNTKNR